MPAIDGTMKMHQLMRTQNYFA